MAPLDGPNASLDPRRSDQITLDHVETAMASSCGVDASDMLKHSDFYRHDDDDSSTGSLAIFDQQDFEKETWGSVVTPTSIVAVVAGVGLLTVLNPLILIPVYAAAFGASQIMSHAHELLTEEYELWKNSNDNDGGHVETVTVSTEKKEETLAMEPESAPSIEQNSPTSVVIAPNATFETMKSSDDEDTNVLSQHFPSLEDDVVSNIKLEGLNGLEFFNVFLGDNAPFSFYEFQTKRGDVDIHYGKWTNEEESLLHNMQHFFRTITFKTQTKSLFGPPYASCTKQQHVYMNKRLLIMDCKVQLQGIPFSDRFYVKERWILQSPKSKVASLYVSSQVFFTQQCAFEEQIHSKSQSTIQEVVTSWCTMAQQALKITIQHKLEREQCESLSHVKPECSIEVARSESSGKSFVLGEDENEPPNFLPMVVVEDHATLPLRKQPFGNFKRSVLARMSKKTNQA